VDGSGNPVFNSRTERYAYDARSRLKSVDYGDGQTQGYTFDAMGNRLGKTDTNSSGTTTTASTYDAANRLLTAGASTYTSDADGNTLTDGARTNVWDSQNRLVSCTANGVTSTYTYGADGLRRSSTVNGVTTYYVYDGTMLVREMQQNAQGVLQPTATYLCGPRGPEYRRDDTQAEGTYTDSGGVQHPAGKTRWYVYDGLGSVVGEVDPSGNLTSSGTFDVYGAKRQGGTGTATSRQGFVGALGHVTDSETGLVYMRARYYDPSVGRFVSQDPRRDGCNWFIYCQNNPTNGIDFDGEKYKAGVVDVSATLGLVLTCGAILAFEEGAFILAANMAGAACAMLAVSFWGADANQEQAMWPTIVGAIAGLYPLIDQVLVGGAEGAKAAGLAAVAITAATIEGMELIGAIASMSTDG